MNQSQRHAGERYYQNEFPEVDEIVMIRVTRTQGDTGAYAQLLEYGNLEGLILGTELSKRRVRSIKKLVKIGRLEVAVVLKVDTEKGYVDLSKRRVQAEDFDKCQEKYVRGKTVFQMIRHLAVNPEEKKKKKLLAKSEKAIPEGEQEVEKEPDFTVEFLNSKITWPLTRKYGDPLKALQDATENPDILYNTVEGVDRKVLDRLLETLRTKMSPNVMKIRIRLDICCYETEGVDAVKAAFRAGREAFEQSANPELEVGEFKIKLVAPPKYTLLTSSLHKEEGIRRITIAKNAIEETISKAPKNVFKAQEVEVIGSEMEHTDAVQDLNLQQSEDESDEDESDEEEEDEVGMGKVDDPMLNEVVAEED